MNPYLALYLGGAAATAFGALSSAQFRWARPLFTVPVLLVGSALWPLAAFFPIVQWLAVKYRWGGASKVKCPACGNAGIARFYPDDATPDALVPPGGWFVTIVPGPGEQQTVLMACSLICAERLKRDFRWEEA